MASVVKPGLSYASLGQEILPVLHVAARVDRLAVRLGGHPTAFLPYGPGVLTLPLLVGPMLDEQFVELIGQHGPPAAGSGLHVSLDQAAAVSPRAPPRMTPAVGRA